MNTQQRIRQCRKYRREALAAPLGPKWDEQDRASYLYYLDKTERTLREIASWRRRC